MATLYVTEQNAWIRKTGDRLVLEKNGEELADIPCIKLETVLLVGNVQFSTQALVEMLDHGIELAARGKSQALARASDFSSEQGRNSAAESRFSEDF